jgi:hypothetical protein
VYEAFKLLVRKKDKFHFFFSNAGVGGGMGGAASHVQQLLVSAVMQGEDFCAEAFAHHLILEARRYSGCLRY